MQLPWNDVGGDDWIVIGFLCSFFALGLMALVRLAQKRRAALRAYLEDEAPPLVSHTDADVVGADAASPPVAGVAGVSEPEELPADAPEHKTDTVEAPAYAQHDAQALQAGLAQTHASLWGRIQRIFSGQTAVDDAVLDSVEEVLLTADVGVNMAMQLMDTLREHVAKDNVTDVAAVQALLKTQLQKTFENQTQPLPLERQTSPQGQKRPKVILFVGVNGVGKTTSIGKLAQKLTDAGKKVLLAAGDTFRAAAAEQLGIWGERTGARVVRGDAGADPASVMFNAVEAAKQGDFDFVLADTAGRLHTKVELMDEIKKVRKAIGKVLDGAPDETWLVVDATTGQNALQQAKEFHQALTLSGVILTKLDGTAKGGIVVAIVDALKIPVVYVGIGEQAQDLMPFAADRFIEALFAPQKAA